MTLTFRPITPTATWVHADVSGAASPSGDTVIKFPSPLKYALKDTYDHSPAIEHVQRCISALDDGLAPWSGTTLLYAGDDSHAARMDLTVKTARSTTTFPPRFGAGLTMGLAPTCGAGQCWAS